MAEAQAPQPRRTLSRESCAQPRETESAFAAFLSDGSSDEDEDDADSRALVRMQQQADDDTYNDAPFKVDQIAKEAEREVTTDVMELITLVERVTVLSDSIDTADASKFEEPKRKTSVRETESAFADFLSDGSGDEDEDDADARTVLRMQQQEDDRMYVETPLKVERTTTTNNSFRLTLAKPELDEEMGPRKFVEMKRDSEVVESSEDVDLEEEQTANESFKGPEIIFAEDTVEQETSNSRPPSFEDDDSFFNESRPSFSDEHSFTGGDSFTDNSFVGRPSLPDEEENPSKHKSTSFVDTSFVYRPSLPDEVHVKTEEKDQQTNETINDNSFVYRPSLPDNEGSLKINSESNGPRPTLPDNEETQKIEDGSNDTPEDVSFVYRPTLPDDEAEVKLDDAKPESSSSAPAEDNNVIYRPSVPDDTPEIVFGCTHRSSTNVENTFVYRPSLPDGTLETPAIVFGTTRQSSTSTSEEKRVVYRPSLPDKTSEIVFGSTRTSSISASINEDKSFVYRPSLPDDTPEIVFGVTHPSSTNISTNEEDIFEFRPTLPDDKIQGGVLENKLAGDNSDAAVQRKTLEKTEGEDFTSTNSEEFHENEEESSFFEYRSTLPGETQSVVQENKLASDNFNMPVQEDQIERTEDSTSAISEEVYENENEPSFLSPTTSSFIRSSDVAAFTPGDLDDSSFRLHNDEIPVEFADDSFNSVLTDSCASAGPPTIDGSTTDPDAEKSTPKIAPTEEKQIKTTAIADDNSKPVGPENDGKATTEPVDKSTPAMTPAEKKQVKETAIADDSSDPVAPENDEASPRTAGSRPEPAQSPKIESAPSIDMCIKPSLSRHSSVASSTGSSQDLTLQQRRLTATRESWRVSSLDLRESKHAFDEELGPLAGRPQSPRASAVENEQQHQRLSTFEERASNVSSVRSFHSQADFFVDDIQQSFSSVSSLSLDSRASGDDSFSNVAILGDEMRDPNERRSSDIISGVVRSSSISAAYPIATETLDRSYNLADIAVGLDRSYSNLLDHEGINSSRGNLADTKVSANGTSFGSSLASSAISLSSATSDELPFQSFNASKFHGAAAQPKVEENELSSSKAPNRSGQQNVASTSQQVFYKSIAGPQANDSQAKLSRSPSKAFSAGTRTFSSSALLAAIKTRETRTNTRSEETEAGDVALGALPPLAPPLKINLVTRGRGSLSSSLLSSSVGSSPSISPSPLVLSARSSVASSTGTADRLDFTGVYRGSVNSLEASRNNGVAQSKPETKQEELQQNVRNENTDALKIELLGVKLERSVSDSRTMQREAQRKVEAFFQRTYEKNTNDIDEREIQRWPTRKTRARTTVNRSVGNMQDNEAKVIDLKNLRNGGKHPGWHLENDEPLTPQYEENSTKQVAMAMTVGTSSTGTTATRSMPSDHVPMAPNYVISPQAEVIKPKVLAKKKSQTAKAIGNVFAAISSGPGGDGVSRFGAVGGRRADNVSLTPTLPRLSASESSMLTPSPFVSSLATPTGFGESGATLRSPAKSPVAFATTASGFTWKAGNVFKRSTIDGLGTSQFSQRSTLAGRVQSLSASLASTLRRMLQGKDAQRQDTNRGVTSPQSQCTAPAALPRAYDQNGFYEAPFKVPGLNKPLEQRQQKIVESDRAWTRQWLILATCAVLGLSLGAILVRVVSYNSSVFNLSADEVHELQKSNGELVLAAGVRWMLLPGNLFLRVWSVVTTLLLFCYVSTSLTDLVGCADKSTLVLSYRSIGYTLLLAILAACEGILAMWITHSSGWFRGYNETIVATASALSNAIGVTPLPDGAVGLVCSEYGEYLQDLGHNVFACSNASLALPLYEEVSINSSGIAGSGPAVFALHEVTDVLATPTPSIPYYPDSLGSGWKMTTSLLSRLTPDNVIAQFTRVDFDEMASLGGLIVFGLLLGYVCGKRILTLRRDAQAAMFETAQSSVPDPHKSRHYIIGILMELQLALEWLIRPIERYVAPLGFFSLMLGNVVLHHREWRSFTSPMASLIVGVTLVLFLHAILILPIVLRLLSSSRRRLPLLTTMRAFTPAFIFAFITDNLALSAPITMQCYARVHTVTRSGAQLTTAVTAALIRNARALYLPLLVLWLLETSSTKTLALSPSDYISVGLLSLVSSFCGGNTRLTMAITRTLWSVATSDVSRASNLLPPTMSLLVVCDVALSRIASVVSVADHLVLTHLVSQHWDETVVQGVANVHVDEVPSPSPLDDSQAPRPSSSAMLSSVYL